MNWKKVRGRRANKTFLGRFFREKLPCRKFLQGIPLKEKIAGASIQGKNA